MLGNALYKQKQCGAGRLQAMLFLSKGKGSGAACYTSKGCVCVHRGRIQEAQRAHVTSGDHLLPPAT